MPLDPSIPAGAFSNDDQSRMPNYGQMALQRGVVEDRDKERQNQAEIERIAKASGGDYDQMILAMRARGMHKEADAYETEKVNTRIKNSNLLDATLARESKIVGQGASYASSVLEMPDVDPATMTIPQMTAHMAQIKAAYGRAKAMTAALGRPEVAEEVYGEFDPMTWRTRMQQAVTMGTSIVELNSVKREALEYIRDGKWEPGLQRWLSTVQSTDPKTAQAEWDRILSTAKAQGMPKSVLDRFPKQWSTEAVQQMKELQLTENEKQDNKTQATNAEAALINARTASTRAGVTTPTGRSAVDERQRLGRIFAADTARENATAQLEKELATGTMTASQKTAYRASEEKRIRERYDRDIKRVDEMYPPLPPPAPPPPAAGTAGAPASTSIEELGTTSGVTMGSGPAKPPVYFPSQGSVGSATAPPQTSIPEMAGVAQGASTNPNSPAPVAPPPPAPGPPPPVVAPPAPTQAQPGARPGIPHQWGVMDRGEGPASQIGVEPAPSTAPPPPPKPKTDINLPKEKMPMLSLARPSQRQAIRDRVATILRAIPPDKDGNVIEVNDKNIDLFLSKPKNRDAYNIVEK